MRQYLDQVKRVAQTGFHYVTLEACLVIPDMCAGLESPDGRTTEAGYQAWFDQHVAPKYAAPNGQFLTGQDCYGLRCAMLHQGRLEPHKGSYSRIVFTETPNVHSNIMNDALNLSVTRFAADMIESAEAWLVTAENTPEYRANYPRFIQRYPEGLAPYIMGIPVIA